MPRTAAVRDHHPSTLYLLVGGLVVAAVLQAVLYRTFVVGAGEIGQELHLSANTIKTHSQAIYRKLGVSTRHDAVRQGHDAGLLLAAPADLRSARVAVRGGLLSLEEACSRYTLTVEEFLSWQASIDQHGLAGLRTTRIQQYRA